MLKKFLIGTLVAVALMATSAYAADFGTTTLRVGSKGEAVKAVQTLVGASVDGSFGPMTAAKVKVWQAANGLVADGVFGNMSKAKANGAVSGNFPVGCTSATGFSSTTGLACVAIPSTTAGCPAGALFNSATGASCTSTSTVAGCAVGALFSATTGASCTGTAVVVTGGAGDIGVAEISTDVENKLVEGQADVKGLGFKVEAKDSDIKVTNMKITMTKGATGSTYLDRYVSDVAVWMNGSKVATVAASDFTKDTTGVYSKSVALSDAVVKEGTNNKATFYVTTTGLSNIDSVDMDATWLVAVDNFRFIDGTGVIMTYNTPSVTPINNILEVSDITSGDVKMVISKGTASPIASTVEVSTTGSTSDVLMLEVKAKNTGADMTFDSMTFDLTTNATNLSKILGELVLKEGSTELASLSSFGTATATTEPAVFDLDSTYTIKSGETKYFRVYATINDVDNFGQGKMLSVDYNKTDTIFEVANTRTTFVETGDAMGEDQTFLSTGAVVKFVSDSYTAPTTDATPIDGTISLTFTVTAFGDADITLNKDGTTNTTAINGGSGSVNFTGTTLTSSGLTADSNGNFIVTAGDTKTFTISKKLNTVVGFITLKLTNVAGTSVSNVETAAK